MSFAPKLSTVILISLLLASPTLRADNLIQQWKQGLSGAKLTTYSGSAISSNSTLTVINLCRNGRFTYYREGSWSVPGMAGGASNNTLMGNWDVQRYNNQIMLLYKNDNGEQGGFPIYLQNNGRVNIGGTAYAVQQGMAEC
ncbi:hypothetical protein [Motiliproteus sp. MSK22-1]|uniref:hypothetical protein n=1 Tax=Motiliproteus sp. MSK22-1 TaxID=1897630 RepID=UPI000977C831|nr:hypothetical protein [Motiliproteus sp. MSK22-1]OMH30801.1 hypothetical protein BGP75_17395 [Motiliproteus sp. MSK22-1]